MSTGNLNVHVCVLGIILDLIRLHSELVPLNKMANMFYLTVSSYAWFACVGFPEILIHNHILFL